MLMYKNESSNEKFFACFLEFQLERVKVSDKNCGSSRPIKATAISMTYKAITVSYVIKKCIKL